MCNVHVFLTHFTKEHWIQLKLHQFISGGVYIQETKFDLNPICNLRDETWACDISACNTVLHQFVSGGVYIQETKFDLNPICNLRDETWAYDISACNTVLDLLYTFSWLISPNNIGLSSNYTSLFLVGYTVRKPSLTWIRHVISETRHGRMTFQHVTLTLCVMFSDLCAYQCVQHLS